MDMTLTPEEQVELDGMVAELKRCGYEEKDHHNELRRGARIRSIGHQWPEAYTTGTGVVLVVTERPKSAWSQSWGMPDVEMVVLWDRPTLGDTRLSQVAQYHVSAVAA